MIEPDNSYTDGNLIKKVESFHYLGLIMKVVGISNKELNL